MLAAGGSALDAVVAAVRVLEDDPEFNAGTGSVLTRDGQVETDAAVMCGATYRVGAVAAVPDLGCAVALARAVLDAGEHVLLVGPAAWRFAQEVGIARAAPGALVTERRRGALASAASPPSSAAPSAPSREIATAGSPQRRRPAASFGRRGDRVGDFAGARAPGRGPTTRSPCPRPATARRSCASRSRAGSRPATRRALDCRSIDRRARPAARAHTSGSAGVIAVGRDGIALGQLSATMPVAWVTADGRADGLGRHVIGL